MKKTEKPRLNELCSIRIGGLAPVIYYPETNGEFCALVSSLSKKDIVLIGGGTNLVFADEVWRPLVSLREMPAVIDISMDGVVHVSAGIALAKLINEAAQAGWGGLEALAGIPGTVGGAVCMNAGANGACLADYLERVEVFVPEQAKIMVFEKKDLALGYRTSVFQHNNFVVLSAQLRLKQDNPAKIKAAITENISKRFSCKVKYPNCGSVFKNPSTGDKTAGMLLEEAGLKGTYSGGLCVSEVHANYFENFAGAVYSDFTELCKICYNKVKDLCGVELELEVKVIK